MTEATAEALRWAARAVAGRRVADVQGLRDGGNPWLLRFDGSGTVDAAVLRIGSRSARDQLTTEVAALQVAERHALAAPRLLAEDLDGAEFGAPAVLTTVLPGNSRIPQVSAPARLRALGASAATLAVAVDPAPGLPFRRWPMDVAFSGFRALRDAPADSALLAEVQARVAEAPVPAGPEVLAHGDLWQGNTMWHGDVCTGVIDWDCAGIGSAWLDLANLRCDAAILDGLPAADEVRTGWLQAAGSVDGLAYLADSDLADGDLGYSDLAYWDLAAALSTPADLPKWLPAIHGQGRTDLDAATVVERRDAFLRDALDRL